MFFRRFWLALLFAAWIVMPAGAAPLEAYGKLPSIEQATVSPSGHAVAVVVTDGEKRTIVVKELASDAITLKGFVGEHKVRSVQWAGDGHLVVVTSATSNSFEVTNGWREWYFASVIELKTKRLKPLMRNEKADLQSIFDIPVVRTYRGETSVFAQGIVFANGRGLLSLFRLDLASGRNSLVQTGSPETIDWAIDSEGNPLAQEQYNAATGAWSLKLRSGSGWREAASATQKLDRPYLIGLGRDNGSAIYSERDEEGHWSWREVRADGTESVEPLPAGGSQAIRGALDGRLIGRYAQVGDENRYSFFDPADARAWQAILTAFPGERVSLESWSTDRRKIVVLVDSEARGPAFAVVDLSARSANWLGGQYAGLKPEDIAPRRPLTFKAKDGRELTGYLTLPQGRPAKNLPLIVFPHGGPAARDTPDFDWWAQGMASRGYAVLQVNFRGSEGLGPELLEAGYGQWGRKMQTDLSDGVRDLAGQGTIDPKRVCIVGASYGGYAALAGATLDPGVYRCAASVAGLSDLPKFVDWSRSRSGQSAYRYWNRFMGVESGRDPALTEVSPAAHVEAVSIPVLLIHGEDDTVVPIEQSRIMADALRKAGKPVDLIVQKGADHWLSRGDTRLQTLTATMAFVEKHNPPN